MSGILSKIFGADKAVEKVFDAAERLTDEAFYTREEESRDKAAATTEARGLLVNWLEATSPSRIARRVLALSVTFVWLLMYICSMFFALLAVWMEDKAARLVASGAIIDGRIDSMTGAVMLVFGFYFAAPYLGEFATKAINRFGGEKQ